VRSVESCAERKLGGKAEAMPHLAADCKENMV